MNNIEKNKELVRQCISLFTDYSLRFDELEFLHTFITYLYTCDFDLAIDIFADYLESVKSDYQINKIYDVESELFYRE